MTIPVIRTYLQDGELVQRVVGQINKPAGQRKITIPVELPEVSVSLSDDTKNTLYIVTGTIAATVILSKLL